MKFLFFISENWVIFIKGVLGGFFEYFIQHCFICCSSDSTVSEDAGIEPHWTVATLSLAVWRSNHSARSHNYCSRISLSGFIFFVSNIFRINLVWLWCWLEYVAMMMFGWFLFLKFPCSHAHYLLNWKKNLKGQPERLILDVICNSRQANYLLFVIQSWDMRSKKFKMAPMEYLGAWGTLIHEKNLKSKISCQTPFKQCNRVFKEFVHLSNYCITQMITSSQSKKKKYFETYKISNLACNKTPFFKLLKYIVIFLFWSIKLWKVWLFFLYSIRSTVVVKFSWDKSKSRTYGI